MMDEQRQAWWQDAGRGFFLGKVLSKEGKAGSS